MWRNEEGREAGVAGDHLFCVDLIVQFLKNNKYLYVILIFNESHKLAGMVKCMKSCIY